MNMIVRFPVMLSKSMLMGSVFTFMGVVVRMNEICMLVFVGMRMCMGILMLMRSFRLPRKGKVPRIR